jgi:hypothetical protein
MCQEENAWRVTLERDLLSEDQVRLRARYQEEMARYATPAATDERHADEQSIMSWGGR